MTKSGATENRVLGKSILISGILLSILLIALELLFPKLFEEPTAWSNGVKTGLSLLLFWVVITSTLRAMNKLEHQMEAIKLILGGVGIAALGIALYLVTMQFLNWFEVNGAEKPRYGLIGFYSAGGFIVSVLSLINLRVKSKMIGDVLEFLVILVVALLFFKFAQ